MELNHCIATEILMEYIISLRDLQSKYKLNWMAHFKRKSKVDELNVPRFSIAKGVSMYIEDKELSICASVAALSMYEAANGLKLSKQTWD